MCGTSLALFAWRATRGSLWSRHFFTHHPDLTAILHGKKCSGASQSREPLPGCSFCLRRHVLLHSFRDESGSCCTITASATSRVHTSRQNALRHASGVLARVSSWQRRRQHLIQLYHFSQIENRAPEGKTQTKCERGAEQSIRDDWSEVRAVVRSSVSADVRSAKLLGSGIGSGHVMSSYPASPLSTPGPLLALTAPFSGSRSPPPPCPGSS